MAQLTLSQVSKSFGPVGVLKPMDLAIDDGEFAVFVGPSGCGKSTLLRTIAGLEDATGGEISIDGMRVNEVDSSRRGLSMVFQNYALYPHMTIFDNMAFGLKIARTPRPEIERRVNEAAAILEIAHLLERYPKTLSGGQRQRVAIGRAIVRDPKIFLFDEPLSNLDAELRVQMRIEVARLHERPRRDDDLRHPRSGRGDDAGRQDRRAARWRHRAGRRAARSLQRARQSLRRRLHRLARDELPTGVIARDGTATGIRLASGASLAVPGAFDVAEGTDVTLGVRPEAAS